MALEFTKLSEVPLVEKEEIAAEATILIENNGEVVRTLKDSVGGGGKGVMVIGLASEVEENYGPIRLAREINDELTPYESEEEFLEDYYNKKMFFNIDIEEGALPIPASITNYGMDGYG